jgi:hypothetical protein
MQHASAATIRRSISLLAAAVAPLLFLAAAAQAQQSGSLADAARQARTQKQGTPQADVNRAQQVADQLSEDQNTGDAPGGFKTYNAGDYKVSVPAPYTVDGHDDGGVVLLGPTVGSKRAVVLLGTPMVAAWGNNDTAFHDAAVHFASLYLTSAKCTKTTVADHDGYQCGLAGANLLGRRISGNAMFVRVAGNIYPIFCAAPTDSRERDILNDPHSSAQDKYYARVNLDREEQDVRSVWQKCDTVLQSLHVIGSGAAKTAKSQPPAPSSSAVPPAAGAEAANPSAPGSLADVARQLQQDPAQTAKIPAPPTANPSTQTTTVPAGFNVHAFKYCSGLRQCWDASVLVPVDAQLVSSDCQQYAFEVKVQGSPFLLMAGPAGGSCDNGTTGASDPVRWHQLVDPENKRAPGTYVTISSWQAKLDGRPGVVTTIGFRKLLVDWMGRRAEVEANGVPLVVGCMAQKEHFTDGEAICSALIESLRLP